MPHRHTLSAHQWARFEIRWPAWVIWIAAWALLFGASDHLSLGNLALLLVLASAMSSLWLSALASICVSALSVACFNWFFVPPRFTFEVHLHQDLLLLLTMLGVSTVMSYLTVRLRAAAALEAMHASASEALRLLGEHMRETTDAAAQAQSLQSFVQDQSLCVCVVRLGVDLDPADAMDAVLAQGLTVCMHEGVAFGAGTGRHENYAHVFLPLRGRTGVQGAMAILDLGRKPYYTPLLKDYFQQAADMLGLEMERRQTLAQTQKVQQEAQQQSLRNTLLTAISHDYRTPLASLMSAASVLHDQARLLTPEKVQSLSQVVLDEAQHLNRMTSNTLQLARLDASPLSIKKDWESVHEFVGVALRNTRQRFAHRRIESVLPPVLPLVFCDALLLVQMFENLLENAIKYSPPDSLIQVRARVQGPHIDVVVADQGCGIDDTWKARVFQAFERGQSGVLGADASQPEKTRRGVGVGLAVCQAIAKVHGASIAVQDNEPQGTVMCVSFPVLTQPTLGVQTPD